MKWVERFASVFTKWAARISMGGSELQLPHLKNEEDWIPFSLTSVNLKYYLVLGNQKKETNFS